MILNCKGIGECVRGDNKTAMGHLWTLKGDKPKQKEQQ